MAACKHDHSMEADCSCPCKDREIERLRAALKPFAEFAAMIEREHPGWYHRHFNFTDPHIPMTWLIDAREAFGNKQSKDGK